MQTYHKDKVQLDPSLNEIIYYKNGVKPKISELADASHLSRNTIRDALNRPVSKTSFGVVSKILNVTNISIEKIAELLTNEKLTPEEEEIKFLNSCDLSDKSIMGIKFSSDDNYWKTRDSILNNIYEGFSPTKENVVNSYMILEEHKNEEKVLSNIIEKYRED